MAFNIGTLVRQGNYLTGTKQSRRANHVHDEHWEQRILHEIRLAEVERERLHLEAKLRMLRGAD
jgi:hypothetical protein